MASADLRTENPEDIRALVKWLRAEDDLRSKVSYGTSEIAPGRMGAALDAAVVILTSGTATVLVRSVFDWLKHRRTTSKVTLTLRDGSGQELELTCGSTDDAKVALETVRSFLEP